ncbi:hypothetical protein H6P81_012761 [Aristolochia fimbriata]|uniref:Uncharacterized protein n=1 Tax=Aristolochia fimbriata TaxID=158543 RepID=A0AAV7ECT4_ARIFI|nr:hypothetical protein H6P81_012761 [Aristolochia fimbriata]
MGWEEGMMPVLGFSILLVINSSKEVIDRNWYELLSIKIPPQNPWLAEDARKKEKALNSMTEVVQTVRHANLYSFLAQQYVRAHTQAITII